jgi:AcrR family transcriptional regulator
MEQPLADAQLLVRRETEVVEADGPDRDGSRGGGRPGVFVAGDQKVDGRRARGARTKDAIVSALMDLIGDGDISPTAQRIADRAGVSVRSVYQHFADVEGLYADASARTLDWVRSSWVEIDPDWPLARKIDEYSSYRVLTLEALSPFSRASRLIEPTSAVMRENRSTMRRWERERIAEVFSPELGRVGGTERDACLCALDTLTSTEAWEHLRGSGQSVRSARLVLRSAMVALLAGTAA